MDNDNRNFIPVSQSYNRKSPNFLGSKTFIFSLRKKRVIKFYYMGAKPYLDLIEFYNALSEFPTIIAQASG